MPLNLNDLMEKAKNRGITTSLRSNNNPGQLIRPWQQESVLFETIHKTEKNEQQPEKSIKNQPLTNKKQTGNKPTTNEEDSKGVLQDVDDKKKDRLAALPAKNGQQTGNTIITRAPFSSLVGLQRAIIIFIYNECKIARSKTTESLTLEHLSSALKASCGCIKTTIQRLEAKGAVERVEFKNGRGGWSKYAIPDLLFQELLQYESNNKLATNWQQQYNNLSHESTKPSTTSSDSNICINTTTTLPEDFKQIDFSALSEIGFDESHVIQIYREYSQKPELSLSAEIVQNSINALAFDLKYNNVANDLKRPPAVFLTYLLKKGQPYSSKTPEKVLTPREESMREYVLAQEKKNLKLLEIETMAKGFALKEWLDALPDEELFSFNPENNVRPTGMPEKLYQLSKRKKAIELAKEYFNTILWPEKRSKFLNEGETTDKVIN